jgi:hypothetical protein
VNLPVPRGATGGDRPEQGSVAAPSLTRAVVSTSAAARIGSLPLLNAFFRDKVD